MMLKLIAQCNGVRETTPSTPILVPNEPCVTTLFSAKKESDRKRAKTRGNLGRAFTLGRELQDLRGFKNDLQFVFFLLDQYKVTQPAY